MENSAKQIFKDVTPLPVKYANYKEQREKSFTISDGIDKEGLGFSKGTVIASLLIYLFIVIVVLYLALTLIDAYKTGVILNSSSMSGMSWLSAALAATITSSVALPSTCIVWYLKKTQTGYTAKVMREINKDAVYDELSIKKELMQLQHDLKTTDLEMNKLDINSKAQQISNSTFNDMTTTIRNSMTDATSLIKKETGV